MLAPCSNRMRNILPLCLALAACSAETIPENFDPDAKAKEQAAKERAADRAAVRAGFAPEAPAPMKTVSVDPPKTNAPGSILPPGDRQYRYIGRWAATPALCAIGAWRFQTRKLSTAGETSCELPTIAAVPTGYELSGVCQAEGRKTEQTLKLGFDDAKRIMTVRGKTLGPVSLIYCGD